jgi:hypothetical protein
MLRQLISDVLGLTGGRIEGAHGGGRAPRPEAQHTSHAHREAGDQARVKECISILRRSDAEQRRLGMRLINPRSASTAATKSYRQSAT